MNFLLVDFLLLDSFHFLHVKFLLLNFLHVNFLLVDSSHFLHVFFLLVDFFTFVRSFFLLIFYLWNVFTWNVFTSGFVRHFLLLQVDSVQV